MNGCGVDDKSIGSLQTFYAAEIFSYILH